MKELKFATENQALQHLANITGKRIKIAEESDDSWLQGKNYFDVAQGLYWFAADYHSGQSSSLYSILSAQLNYKPARSENGPESGDAQEVYNHLASLDESEQTSAAEDALEYVEKEYAKEHGMDESEEMDLQDEVHGVSE